MSFYLRLEGVNLYSSLQDTDDLSVIRGSSLLLLWTPREVEELLTKEYPGKFEPIITGASAGLFYCADDQGLKPEDVVSKVKESLAKDENRQHLTFIVDWTTETENFQADRAKLVSKIRWQQMRSMRLKYPSLEESAVGDHLVCGLDGVRPAAEQVDHWDSERRKPVTEVRSASAHARHEFGRKQKTEFFKSEVKHIKGAQVEGGFALHLSELAGKAPESAGPLRDKLAVIYLDGNGFGKLYADHCGTREEQKAASDKLKKHQRQFLWKLLQMIERDRSDDGWWVESTDPNLKGARVRRLEVLLWGGDEIRLVVPAWKGWQVADLFFQCARTWRPFGENIPVKHAMSIVFCKAKCPIHAVSRLGDDLAEICKKESKSEDLLSYLILESFDHIGEPIDRDYFAGRYGFVGTTLSDTPNPLLVPGVHLEPIWEKLQELRNYVPRRKLHDVARLLARGKSEDAQQSFRKTLDGLPAESKASFEALTSIFARAGEQQQDAAIWHLSELWDYAGFEQWP